MNYIREETVVTLMGYQISALYRIIIIQCIGKLFFIWKFKGNLWNSKQKITPIHCKMWFIHKIEISNLRPHKCFEVWILIVYDYAVAVHSLALIDMLPTRIQSYTTLHFVNVTPLVYLSRDILLSIDMGQVTELRLSNDLVLLSVDTSYSSVIGPIL